MTRSTYNEGLVDRVRNAVVAFQIGDLDLDGIQATLESAISIVERDGSRTADVIRAAEADVEEIRFTRLLDEQRPEVVFRLDQLLAEFEEDTDHDGPGCPG